MSLHVMLQPAVVLLVAAVTAAPAQGPRKPATRAARPAAAAPVKRSPPPAAVLADFRSPKADEWAAASGLSASAIVDSSGTRNGTEVGFPGGEAWRGLVLRVPRDIPRSDWNGWEGAVLDVENRETAEVRVAFSVRNAPD